MGIPPDNWGPYAWATIHLACLDATKRPTEPATFTAFFESLSSVLPCKKCRDHLRENLGKMPPITADTDMFAWSVDLHNVVNTMLKKPTMTRDAALAHWTNVAKGAHGLQCHCKKKKKWLYLVLAFFMGLVLGWLVFKHGKERRK
jgi:hypothetical protein